MSRLYRVIIGLALVAIGTLKLQYVAHQSGEFTLPTCFGNTVTLHIGTESTLFFHCWGCYVAALGATLLLSSALDTARNRRAKISVR